MGNGAAEDLLRQAIQANGEEVVLRELRKLCAMPSSKENVLTIIANEGVHHLPEEFVRGEVYTAHEGSFDFSSPNLTHSQIRDVLIRLAEKLKSKPYHRIYLVPFGHSVPAMQIKLLVYRICHIETTDVFYIGAGRYFDYQENLRDLVLNASPET